jgi:UDP-N-acetylmuramoyl-tripeptide--D-alanyl-D-alanine ligase
MIELTLAQVADSAGGILLNANDALSAIVVTGSVETDSRLVASGSLFVAKPGEVTDGHNFLQQAKDAGAVAAIVEREVTSVDLPQILVTDAVLALGKLAAAVLAQVRAETGLKVVGITGSNGKTTTKNMLRAILSTAGETIAPIESYNNEVGAPISVLKISRSTKFLVAELGAGGLGSIDYLANITKPDVAVELKVGLAHAGEFGGIEVTAKIKAELLAHVAPDGVAILNFDDGYVRAMGEKFNCSKIWFGTSANASYWADGYELSLAGTSFDLHWPDSGVQRVTLRILGEHHVMNALASISVADYLGVPRADIISALESLPLAERWRMQLTEGADGISYINDAYNASPDSTKAALQTLAQLGRQTGRRTVAIIGEMAELGEFSRQEHDAIGRLCVRLNLGLTIAIGEGARLVYMGASLEGSYDGEAQFLESLDGAFDVVRGMLRSGDIVLIKSSKSANLRHLGDQLAEAEA